MLSAFGRDRVQWLAVAALVAACNGISGTLLATFARDGLLASLFGTGGINPIFWFAMLAAGIIAFEPDRDAPPTSADWLVIAATFALALLPVVSAGSAGVLLAGGWLWLTGSAGSRSRRAGLVLLALTASLIWGHIVLMLIGDRLVALDGSFVAWLAGTSATGNLVQFDDGGRPMMIAYGCSSMHNLTMALQFWVAMTQLLRIPFGPKSLLIALAAALANILVNGARLATIAHNRADFDYWHTGGGGTIFAWIAVITVAAVVMLGCNALAPRRL